MTQRTIFACDRCKKDIADHEARYVVEILPRVNAKTEPVIKDLCGFCAGQMRWALLEADPRGKLICEIPRVPEDVAVAG